MLSKNLWGATGRSDRDERPSLPIAESFEMPPRVSESGNEHERSLHTTAPSGLRQSQDKITCLDGLRGIACLIVFNYHFLWPWTGHIMLGYGALPPKSPQSYAGLLFLPIICLLHRGRPMVAIFFAISGYVLCRHVLKAIHERRIDAAYKSLASAVFRRAFRLYIPPILSMFAVAILAQAGAFRSEKDIFTGPDSRYINGSVTIGYIGRPCTNTTTNSTTISDMADYLRLTSTAHLVNVTRNTTSSWSRDNYCLNSTSQLVGPLSLYNFMNATEQVWWKVALGLALSSSETKHLREHEHAVEVSAAETHNKTVADRLAHGEPPEDPVISDLPFHPLYNDWQWIQLGGSWEEHPIIHERFSYALGNLTTMYAEWGNPFNFFHHHTRYDPHTFTIPMEFRGSIVIYVFLLGTAALQLKWRMAIGAAIAAYSLRMGRWDLALFMGAMLESEMDIRGWHWSPTIETKNINRYTGALRSEHSDRALHWGCTALALYFLSYPDAGAEFTPGFIFLSDWVPRYYNALSGWMFYQAIGALLLLPCILRSPLFRGLLDRPVAQYLGKISFSFYLVHGPVLHSLGFWLMPRLFERFGWLSGLAVGYSMLLCVSLYIADWWHQKVDIWTMTIGKRIERALSE